MRIGIHLGQIPHLDAEAVVDMASGAAERVGYSSIWFDLRPRLGVVTPEAQVAVLTQIATAAATTRHLGVSARVDTGSDIVDGAIVAAERMPLGRSLTLVLGGAGTSAELTAALSDVRRRFDGPLLVAGSPDDVADAVATTADGWFVEGSVSDLLRPAWEQLLARAVDRGRDPATLELVVGLDVAKPPSDRGGSACSDLASVAEHAAGAGCSELVLSIVGAVGVDEALDRCARLAEHLADLVAVTFR